MRADFDAPEPWLDGAARSLIGAGLARVDAGLRSRKPKSNGAHRHKHPEQAWTP